MEIHHSLTFGFFIVMMIVIIVNIVMIVIIVINVCGESVITDINETVDQSKASGSALSVLCHYKYCAPVFQSIFDKNVFPLIFIHIC